jgi:DNA-binding IclR family transcriptional regulator
MPKKAVQPSVADEHAAPGGAAAVDRALSVLGVFSAEQPSLTLTDIAERTRLYKSTALRLLASLEHAKFIQRSDEGRYILGPEVARLYAAYTESFSLASVVVPAMKKLVAATRESASFHVRQGAQRLCLYRVDSPQPIRDHIKAGDLLPLDRGVGGRVLLAFSGEEGELYAHIRQAKIISSIGDRSEDVAGISAPVFDATGKLAGAITLTMPAARFQKAHEAIVRHTAMKMTKELGGPIHIFE